MSVFVTYRELIRPAFYWGCALGSLLGRALSGERLCATTVCRQRV